MRGCLRCQPKVHDHHVLLPGVLMCPKTCVFKHACLCFLQVGCVLVGYDLDFNYTKLLKALCYLGRPGCHFLCTNPDSVLPMGGEGRAIPGMHTPKTQNHHQK